MRYALAAIILFIAPLSTEAAPLADNEFAQYQAFPCKEFISRPSTARVRIIRDGVFDYVSAYGFFDTGETKAAVISTVEGECRNDARFTVGDAVDRLFAKKRNGIPLPRPLTSDLAQ